MIGSQHTIVAKWDWREPGGLGDKVMAALGEAVDWNCIKLFRIGYDDEDPKPVVVWVGVRPGSTTWQVAHDAVMAVREELARRGWRMCIARCGRLLSVDCRDQAIEWRRF